MIKEEDEYIDHAGYYSGDWRGKHYRHGCSHVYMMHARNGMEGKLEELEPQPSPPKFEELGGRVTSRLARCSTRLEESALYYVGIETCMGKHGHNTVSKGGHAMGHV